jgi:hypothetical protein
MAFCGPRVVFVDGTWVSYEGDAALSGDVDEFTGRIGPEWYVDNPAHREVPEFLSHQSRPSAR